jgi:Cd2+/Zn2+-exporting ATPase
VFDSAYDNYHFYLTLVDYCRISPIIKLNKRCQGISYNKDLIFFTPEGIPMCLYGLALTNWGFCSGYKVATSGAVPYVLLFSTRMRVAPIEISVRDKDQITVEYFTPTPKRTTVTLLLFHGIANFGMSFTEKEALNEEGYLEIRVSKTSKETMLSKIVKLVENAQKQKSKTEKFIDRFAKYYTPAVLLLALGVAVVPTLIFGQPLSGWIYKALVLLVVSCPCALAISTPVSMVSAITSAAKNGVLIKGGSYLEEMRKVRVLAFDKTGTLTEGKPEVTDVISLNAYPKRELLQVAVSLESLSKHPIAEAIAKRVQKEGIETINIEKFESVAGKGVKGEIDGRMYYLGNKNFFKEIGIDFPEAKVKDLENQGKTVILIGNDSHTVGIVTLMDKIREGAAKVIRELKKEGIRTVMLTGDNERVARAIVHQLDIDEYYSELLPEEKVKMVEELLRKYEGVVMVGDGVNDAPALAKAHVGIAMGAIGSDVAIETSDVALMQDDLSKVNYLIKLSKRTMDIVRQNVFASILIKGSFAVLVFPGIVTLWLAVAFGDMGLTLGVILNAIRLGRTK